MGDVVRAVSPARKSADAGIQRRLRVVEDGMAALKSTVAADRQVHHDQNAAVLAMMDEVLIRLGKPKSDGVHPSTGLYWAIDAVSERVRPFEAFWLQAKGGVKTVAILAIPVVALIWFLAGDRLTSLLHG